MNIKKYINPRARFIGKYSLDDLNKNDTIYIDANLSYQEIANLEYLGKSNAIDFDSSNNVTDSMELVYFENIKRVFATIGTYRKPYNITISVNNREILRRSGLLSSIPKNITLHIKTDSEAKDDEYIYEIDEYLKEEDKLERLVKNIRDSSLSPLEKYLAVYSIVKNFRPYKDNPNNMAQSRKLRYVLKDDNNYIVCVGFANLLHELLNRVGISNKYIHVDVDDSYKDGYTQEEKIINHVGHARNLVKIDDEKYNIHGLYLADSTFDNKQDYNTFLHSLMTFDRLKEAQALEKLNDYDLLLDFHNIAEFQKKLTFFLRKETKEATMNGKVEENDYVKRQVYERLYLKVIYILKDIDSKVCDEFIREFDDLLRKNKNAIEISELNKIISQFTTKYYQYIIKITNKEINMLDIMKASSFAIKELNNISNQELANWIRKMIDDQKGIRDSMFPYSYDPNNETEAFLENNPRKK